MIKRRTQLTGYPDAGSALAAAKATPCWGASSQLVEEYLDPYIKGLTVYVIEYERAI